MSLLLDEEQRMLRDSAQDFLRERVPVAALRALRAQPDGPGHDPQTWRDISALGWPAAVLPEAYGGLGLGYKGLAAVFEQMGRTLATTPLLSSVVLGAGLVLEAGDEAQRQTCLPVVASGERLLSLALEERPRHDPAGVALRASRTGSGWQLQGHKEFVLDPGAADQFVVVARSAGSPGERHGLSLFLVGAQTPGLGVQRGMLVDSRQAARLSFEGVELRPDQLLGASDQAFDALDRVLDRARLCVAAETMGVITESFERTLAYLKARVQFDVPIGSFQALQHRAARVHVELELLRSCVAAAAEAIDAGDPAAASRVSLAKARAADLSAHALNEAVQMHGGIGVTDEYELGLFLKRARVLQQMLGDGAFHRNRFAQLASF